MHLFPLNVPKALIGGTRAGGEVVKWTPKDWIKCLQISSIPFWNVQRDVEQQREGHVESSWSCVPGVREACETFPVKTTRENIVFCNSMMRSNLTSQIERFLNPFWFSHVSICQRVHRKCLEIGSESVCDWLDYLLHSDAPDLSQCQISFVSLTRG